MYAIGCDRKTSPLTVEDFPAGTDTPPPSPAPKYILSSDVRKSPMLPYLAGLRWVKFLGLPIECTDEEEGIKFVDKRSSVST